MQLHLDTLTAPGCVQACLLAPEAVDHLMVIWFSYRSCGIGCKILFNSTKQRGFPGKWLIWPGAAQTKVHYCSTWVILWVLVSPEMLLLWNRAEKAEPKSLLRPMQLIYVWCLPRWPSPELLVRMHQTGHQYALAFHGIRINSAGAG